MDLFLRFYTYDLINLSYIEGAYSNDNGFVYHANKIPNQILELAESDEIENVYIKLIDEPEFWGNKYVKEFIDIVCGSKKVKINLSGHTYRPTHLIVPEQSRLDFKTIEIQKPLICFTPWSHSIFTPNWIVNANSKNLDQNFYVALELEDEEYMRIHFSENLHKHKNLCNILQRPVINWRLDSEADIQRNANTKFIYGQQISYWLYRFNSDLWEIKKYYDEAMASIKNTQNYLPQENKDEGKTDFGSWL